MLEDCKEKLGALEKYSDYDQMLQTSELDAVIVGTPMHFHVEQSIKALKRDIHVLCEVPAAVSIQEFKELYNACKQSKAVYMLAENYVYSLKNMVISELVKHGLFGQVYYAEGEYLHELKELNEQTPWRRKWQTGIEGVTYGTHSLGPILMWLNEDRVIKVCCEDSVHYYKDPRGNPYAQTTPVMLCKTQNGVLIKIRVDMISNRPHAMTNYQLQGVQGCYESARSDKEWNKIWLSSLNKKQEWLDLDTLCAIDDFAQKYIPQQWRKLSSQIAAYGHGGGDYWVIRDFVRTIKKECKCPIDIHKALDMTLPGLISQQSIIEQGQWLQVPDYTLWK
jgi:predicted dehydrogenase